MNLKPKMALTLFLQIDLTITSTSCIEHIEINQSSAQTIKQFKDKNRRKKLQCIQINEKKKDKTLSIKAS